MTSAASTWDVVIAGAGVGGMALAIRLARRGHRVVLVEHRPPPAFRVGESLDWEAPLFLRRLGLPIDKLVAEGKATWKHGAICTASARPGIEARFGFSPLFRVLMTLVGRGQPTIHVNRELLDVDMLNRARMAGAELIVGRVRSLDTAGDRVMGITLDGGQRLQAKFYVDATGSAGLFRKAFGIGQRTIGPRKVTLRARFPHRYDGTGTRVHTDDSLAEAAWMWDISVSESVTDIGLVLVDTDFVALHRRLGSLREVFLHQVRKHADLKWLEPLVGEEFGTCSFQDMVAFQSSGTNWIAVGEAAFVVDPLLATGFTLALRTGFFASNLVGVALTRRRDFLCPQGRRIYHEKTATHVETVNRVLDVLWYRGRLREHYSLMLNVAAILAINFNLNHLHTRFIPRSLFELRLLRLLHRGIDRLVPLGHDILMKCASRRGAIDLSPPTTTCGSPPASQRCLPTRPDPSLRPGTR